ncbi:MAG: AhpC/TSA family protein [Dysgonamonadaceae bacterium]|jgi:thiol-disulfide isomerase/thioredoxin|nr:AhpC/TSA family protein [Dysgonamonadaceae bacterium]
MKRVIFAGMAALLMGCTSVKEDEFVIKGTVTDYGAEMLMLAYQDSDQFVMDTLKVADGKIHYKTQATKPVMATLISRDPKHNITAGEGIIPGEMIALYIEPGSVLQLTIDGTRWPEISMKGGNLNNDLMKLYSKSLPLKRQSFETLAKSLSASASEEEKAQLAKEKADIDRQTTEVTVDFVKENPASTVALQFLSSLRNEMTLDEYAALFDGLAQAVKETPLGKETGERIEAARRSSVGAIAPDFEKKDKDGNVIRLSDYRGKYVYLDFWASWCAPCRASHPRLIQLYAEYEPKGLVLLGIDAQDTREAWLKAVEDDKLTWPQIANNDDKEKCDVVTLYSVTALPTKFLIDPEGKIIIRDTGEDGAIEGHLKALFGEK